MPPTTEATRKLLAALEKRIDAGQEMIRYEDIERETGQDTKTQAGRQFIYRARQKLLKTRGVWLQNVREEGYRVRREGTIVARERRERRIRGGKWKQPDLKPLLPPALTVAGNARDGVQAERREPGVCRDVCTLPEGVVTVEWPVPLTAASYRDMSDFLQMVDRRAGRFVKGG